MLMKKQLSYKLFYLSYCMQIFLITNIYSKAIILESKKRSRILYLKIKKNKKKQFKIDIKNRLKILNKAKLLFKKRKIYTFYDNKIKSFKIKNNNIKKIFNNKGFSFNYNNLYTILNIKYKLYISFYLKKITKINKNIKYKKFNIIGLIKNKFCIFLYDYIFLNTIHNILINQHNILKNCINNNKLYINYYKKQPKKIMNQKKYEKKN
jgi:hypothetical protein